ncbi:uncharacterized protein TRIREDRAFT_42267, partial [Trichoderma reesei QM6a]
SPLSLAARRGDTERVKQLLEDPDVDLNAVDYWSSTPLTYAARNCHIDIVRMMILLTRNGANANARDRSERTAISWAAQAGQADAVDLLLKHGADANLPDRYGSTPLWYALRENEEEIAKKLI